jgi:hypothetical protein
LDAPKGFVVAAHGLANHAELGPQVRVQHGNLVDDEDGGARPALARASLLQDLIDQADGRVVAETDARP